MRGIVSKVSTFLSLLKNEMARKERGKTDGERNLSVPEMKIPPCIFL